MELLCPAGNMESLKVAIYNGADAVYFGLPNFNARKMADNFTLDSLKDTIDFCHLHNVKAYLTINTLVSDTEMEQVLSSVKKAIEVNVDAFIVADLGLANILAKTFSGIVLHASTQMGIHNLYGALMAEKIGIKRVILARETRLDDIIEIKKNTNLEIEFFVQGALCVAFSGACYLSGYKTGKSGNRGECTQPCRLCYSLQKDNDETSNKGRLLSCRDLCLIKNLKKLEMAGVDSIKIEGRNRRSAYVATVTKSYKKALDAIEKDKQIDLDKEIFTISKVFNRGEFNEQAYLFGDKKNIINPKVSGHKGILIGKVVDCTNFKNIYKIKIETKHKLTAGDGLKFFNKDIEVRSLGVGNVDIDGKYQTIYSTQKAVKAEDVYLTLDSLEEEQILNVKPKLETVLKTKLFSEKFGEFELSYKNISVKTTTKERLAKALKHSIDEKDLKDVFKKNKETVFSINKIEIETDNVFIPVSNLNVIKTQLYEDLKQEILKNYAVKNLKEISENQIELNSFLEQKIDKKIDEINSDIVVVNTLESISSLPKGAQNVAFNGDLSRFKEFYDKVEILSAFKRIGFVLPIFASKQDILAMKEVLSQLDKNRLFLVASSIYGLYFMQENYSVFGGMSLNVFNNFTAKLLQKMGVCGFTFAPELKTAGKDILNSFEASGYLPLMNFSHCPFLTNGGDCRQCKYSKDALLKCEDNSKYFIERQRCIECTFSLISVNEILPLTNNLKLRYLRDL